MGSNGLGTKYKLKKKKKTTPLYNYLITRKIGMVPESHFCLSGIYSNSLFLFFINMGMKHSTRYIFYRILVNANIARKV